jgi:hypothetical protein
MAGFKRAAGVRKLFKSPVPGFPSPLLPYSLFLAAPPVATVLLAVGVVLLPFGRLNFNTLVDV